jgi:transposase
VIIYHMLRDGADYTDLGPDYLDRLQSQRLTRSLVRRLEGLGHKVVLERHEDAA